jgi:diacylglycerol kinase
MVPLYLLALVGVARAWRARNAFFGLAVQCYLAAIVLHGLTRVDAAHRTLFTSFIFLIMLSGYGFDALWGRVRCRWRS